MNNNLLYFIVVFLCCCEFVCCVAPSLRVQGNKIVDSSGNVVKLRGVNRSGAEFACAQGYGIFDGPTNQSSINAIKTWKVNIVRVPLNEDCWLNINGVKPQYGGSNYQNAIRDYVNLLISSDINVILDLHWTASGNTLALKQDPMPNKDHSIDFWSSVAQFFKGNDAIIFDLFNEPFPNGNTFDSAEAWSCWKDGTQCSGINFNVAGMQTLVDAVRGSGSRNILMLGGIAYSNSLTRWLEYLPSDPLNSLAASWHSYNFNYCNTQSCWNQDVAPVAAKHPVIIGEIGENNCAHDYVDPLMQWADGQGLHYLAWTWNTWDCGSGPALISSYDGNPTNFGVGIKNHYA
jgi:hypothetical protein